MVSRRKLERTLTEGELEIMQVIWDLNECTVREVYDTLAARRELAYTSVATMMKILEQKKAVASRKGDKAHTFHPLISRAEYESLSLRHLKDGLFKGDSASMVIRLLNEDGLTKEELAEIKKLMNERLKS